MDLINNNVYLRVQKYKKSKSIYYFLKKNFKDHLEIMPCVKLKNSIIGKRSLKFDNKNLLFC